MRLAVVLALGLAACGRVGFEVRSDGGTTGSTTGTVLQFQTAAAPGQFETTYQSSGPEQWLQSLFAFH